MLKMKVLLLNQRSSLKLSFWYSCWHTFFCFSSKRKYVETISLLHGWVVFTELGRFQNINNSPYVYILVLQFQNLHSDFWGSMWTAKPMDNSQQWALRSHEAANWGSVVAYIPIIHQVLRVCVSCHFPLNCMQKWYLVGSISFVGENG